MREAVTSSTSISDNECSVSVSSSSNLKAPPRKRKKASFLDEWAQKWPWAEDMPDGLKVQVVHQASKAEQANSEWMYKLQDNHPEAACREQQQHTQGGIAESFTFFIK